MNLQEEIYHANHFISIHKRLSTVNSSLSPPPPPPPPPSATDMRQWIGSALIQIIACRLFSAKPLSKPMLSYCHLDPLGSNFSEITTFHSRKCIWKYRLRNGGHFVQGGWVKDAMLPSVHGANPVANWSDMYTNWYHWDDVAMSFWRNNDVVIVSPARWDDMETLAALQAICEWKPKVPHGFSLQRTGNAELWCLLCCLPEQDAIKLIWDAMTLMWCDGDRTIQDYSNVWAFGQCFFVLPIASDLELPVPNARVHTAGSKALRHHQYFAKGPIPRKFLRSKHK